MKTGDIYFNRAGKICIHFKGSESAFNSDAFDTVNKHVGLEPTTENNSILMFNCTCDDIKTTGINIMSILNDPIITEYLKTKCQTT